MELANSITARYLRHATSFKYLKSWSFEVMTDIGDVVIDSAILLFENILK